MNRRRAFQYALCVANSEPDLQQRKVYRVLPDAAAAKTNYVRVIDESGEDYTLSDTVLCFHQAASEG